MTIPKPQRLAELGGTLREVEPRHLAKEKGKRVRWLRSPKNCDLFLWLDQHGRLLGFQVAFARVYLEWTPDGGLVTGQLTSWDPEEPERDRSRMVQDGELNQQVLDAAELILRTSPLEQFTREKILRRLLRKEA